MILRGVPGVDFVRPAVPRSVPASPDQRVTGQARSVGPHATIPTVIPWEPIAEAALLRPGTVIVTPQWSRDVLAFDPDIVGRVRVTVAPPGGRSWRREIDVPGWGIALDVPAGLVVVDVQVEIAGRQWWAGVSPGYTARTWTAHERITTVLAATTVDVDPPAYATRCNFVLVSGSVTFPSPLAPALAPLAQLEIPAAPVAVTGVAATSDFLLQWEVVS